MAGSPDLGDDNVPKLEAPGEVSRWRTAFEAALARILAEYEGQDAKVRDGMESGMRKLFEQPYHVELGLLSTDTKTEALSIEEAQRVVFFPRLSDMRRYVAAFTRDTSAASARRERLMKFKLLAVFYALHRKDGALVDRFTHYGGLESFAALAAEDNNVIQSQAVELLMEVLSPLINMPSAADTARQAHVMHQVFSCLTSSIFWTSLAKIVGEKHEVFPRSHSYCVRILAGAVGWLRPENPNAVPQVVPPHGVKEAAEALKRMLAGGEAAPDVRGLAEDLLEELLAVPRIREDPQSSQESTKVLATMLKAESREDAAHAWQALRLTGNEAFKKGFLWPAEASYRLALEEGGAAVPSEMASLIHSNRALVLLSAGHPAEAAVAAGNSLQHNARNVKAAYRRAQALMEVEKQLPPGETAKRRQHLQDALEAAVCAARLDAKDKKVLDMLSGVQRRLEELGEEEPTEQQQQLHNPSSLESMD